jgi:transcriptional regulator with XRE-family HTH domain
MSKIRLRRTAFTVPQLPAMEPGRRIRFVRTQHQLTQAQLARALGISAGLLSRIERGELRPSLEISQRLLSWIESADTAMAKRLAVQLAVSPITPTSRDPLRSTQGGDGPAH